MKILFINHKSERCGVADYGRRLFDTLRDHMDISMSHEEQEGYDVILYNYHYATLPVIRKMNVPQIALFHEAHLNFPFDKVVNVADLPRPLLPFAKHRCTTPDFLPPVIGSFGFGFPDKNFPGIALMVKREFEKATLRLNIPFAEFGDNTGTYALAEAESCRQRLRDTNITLEISHDFKPAHQMVQWLSENDINVFNHIGSHGRGISSSIDYALTAYRPIAVSNSEMYRHLPREIVVDNISLRRLIQMGREPLKQVYEDNSNEKLVAKIKELIG